MRDCIKISTTFPLKLVLVVTFKMSGRLVEKNPVAQGQLMVRDMLHPALHKSDYEMKQSRDVADKIL